MKKVLSVFVIAAFLSTSCTKENHGADDLVPHQKGVEDNPNGGGGINTMAVPAAVLTAFNASFPDASRIEWKKLSDGNFKVEFFRGTVKWQVIYTSGGTVVKQEHK